MQILYLHAIVQFCKNRPMTGIDKIIQF